MVAPSAPAPAGRLGRGRLGGAARAAWSRARVRGQSVPRARAAGRRAAACAVPACRAPGRRWPVRRRRRARPAQRAAAAPAWPRRFPRRHGETSTSSSPSRRRVTDSVKIWTVGRRAMALGRGPRSSRLRPSRGIRCGGGRGAGSAGWAGCRRRGGAAACAPSTPRARAARRAARTARAAAVRRRAGEPRAARRRRWRACGVRARTSALGGRDDRARSPRDAAAVAAGRRRCARPRRVVEDEPFAAQRPQAEAPQRGRRHAWPGGSPPSPWRRGLPSRPRRRSGRASRRGGSGTTRSPPCADATDHARRSPRVGRDPSPYALPEPPTASPRPPSAFELTPSVPAESKGTHRSLDCHLRHGLSWPSCQVVPQGV